MLIFAGPLGLTSAFLFGIPIPGGPLELTGGAFSAIFWNPVAGFFL